MGDVPAVVEKDEPTEATLVYPLIKMSEIPEETEVEILDTVTGAVDRFISNLDEAAKYIKQQMDRLYEPYWHVVIGENFGFEVTYHVRHIMYAFYMGNLAILVWKCV